MSTIKNDQILPYCHFNKNIKSVELVSSLQHCSSVYDDVTDFEMCGFHKNTEI